jgi:hypothetical protein
VLVAINAEAPPATRAEALSAVTLPVAAKLVTWVAAPNVALTVTAPVVASIEMLWKPFSERTGPEKFVFALRFYLSSVRTLARDA